MSSRLVISSSGAVRCRAAQEWLGTLEPRAGALVVAPTRGAADDLLRDVAGVAGWVFGVERTTLRRLVHTLAAGPLARSGLSLLSGLSVEALVALCTQRVRHQAPFEHFEPVADLPGFPRALARTLAELRSSGLASSQLGEREARVRDLARVVAVFEEELERQGLIDGPGLLALAVEAAGVGRHRLSGLPLLLLDSWPRSPLEGRLIEALVEQAPHSLATLPTGDPRALEALEAVLGDRPRRRIDEAAPASARNRLERARDHLFAAGAGREIGERDESLELFSAPGEDRECVEIARRIRRLAEAGTAFDRIAILLREAERYHPLLENALRRAAIPAWFSRGTRRPDAAGRAFLSLLACAAEGLSASRFAEFLSLGETAEIDASGAPPQREVPWVEPGDGQMVLRSFEPVPESAGAETLPVPAQWERLLVDASVVGGLERWRTRLAGLGAEMDLQLRRVRDEEDARRLHLEAQRRRLLTLERFALPIVESLDGLPDAAPWGEWIERLEGLAARVLRDPTTVLRLLAELRPMSRVGPVGLDQVRGVLEPRLTTLRGEPPARRYGRVFVGTIEEGLGRCFDTVFVPGLAEGIFPRRAGEDPLLLDSDRASLSVELPVREARRIEERCLLHWAIGTGERRVFASFPRLDQAQGRARVPSFYALDLLRAADGQLPDLGELESRAADIRLGWPAPASPVDAIDDAEYDLAFLAPSLAHDSSDLAGRERFLLHTNDSLRRSLLSRALRWRPIWSQADGLVVDREVGMAGAEARRAAREVLLEHLLNRRAYSPTALQSFASCPYRFLLHAIHRLRPRDGLVTFEQLDPMTRGSLFHQIQFRFLGEARKRGLLPVHPDFGDELLELVDESLTNVAELWRSRLAPPIARVWEDEIEALRLDARGWVQRLVDSDSSWTPVNFELAFGLAEDPDHDPDSIEEEVEVLGGVRLRGSIDLVERDWRRQRLRVTDHKTGRPPAERHPVTGGGEILQPVLYALVAESALARAGESVEAGRLFYCTHRGGFEEREVPLDEASRTAVGRLFEVLERGLVDGFLPALPAPDACAHCDYRLVCGPYEEIRTARKAPRPRRLEEIRSQR